MRIWQQRSSRLPSGERRGTNYQEVQYIWRPKIPLSACHCVWDWEYKKMWEASDKLYYIWATSWDVQVLTDAAQCVRYHICEHADQLLFASVFQRHHTSGKQSLYQKPCLCFTVQESHFRQDGRKTGWGVHFLKQTFWKDSDSQVLLSPLTLGCTV